MFDVLLKSKFYIKCKSDIKVTRTRIEMIKRKRKAMQKYLRNDVADLLKNGLDVHAYGRAEGLLVEEIRTSCYESIEPYCDHISNHLSAMDKQTECPEDCREAVSSLMFAAARFADLPELRDLRSVFSSKYGNSLDCYVNKEFVEKLSSGLPSKDMKIKLLQEIAKEYEVEWNSKALENKLFNDEEDFTKETNDSVYPLRDNGLKNARQSPPLEKKTNYKYYEQNVATEIGEERREDVPPVKDIVVDTVNRPEKRNEQESKYSLIPPPYTKTNKNSSLREDEKVGATDRTDTEKKIPKSVRRRNLKPEPSPEVVPESDENKEKVAQGQRILKFFDNRDEGGDQRDEEETMMDKLLQYYSMKTGPRESGEPTNEVVTRASSLPREIYSPRETSTKKHNRAASLLPEMLKPNVHPKLPDYDEFVATLKAYRGSK